MLVQGSPTELNSSYTSFVEDARQIRRFFSTGRAPNETAERPNAPADTRDEEARVAAPKKNRWSFGSLILSSCPEYFEAFA